MLIHQAIYGDDRGGHALLGKSSGESSPFSDLTWRTDLPGTAPSGVAWEPYISGFPDQNHYILAKTFPDPRASRGGMVFTHALFLPLADAVRLNDLRAIAGLLLGEPSNALPLNPLHLENEPQDIIANSQQSHVPNGIAALVEALLVGRKPPVIWIGQEGFEDAIFMLWGHLWPQVRATFSFRLSFGPQDTHDLVPTVVCTLAPLESRWAGYSIVHSADVPASLSDAAKLLLGQTDGQILREFGNELQAELASLSDLKLLENCRQYMADQHLTGDGLLALVRLLTHVSPIPTAGPNVKRSMLEQLLQRIPQMTAAEISSMRNLDLAAFPDGQKMWTAVARWVQTGAVEDDTTDQMPALFSQAASADTSWANAVWKGIDAAIAEQGLPLSIAIWKWWSEDGTLVERLFARLPTESAMEN